MILPSKGKQKASTVDKQMQVEYAVESHHGPLECQNRKIEKDSHDAYFSRRGRLVLVLFLPIRSSGSPHPP